MYEIQHWGITGKTMEVQRMKELLLLWSRFQSNRVALVGGNHTAARFCTR
ncbi:hypothetical protein Goarm_023388 [Gossypium armourianum]|uniref:Uncharacterized protein n=1 Tax=Gossypium armourianum TaxID=34283 RepID=A0A7J9KG52_9ROSI|nr:hypothetical protein [Gossypium armourianum]